MTCVETSSRGRKSLVRVVYFESADLPHGVLPTKKAVIASSLSKTRGTHSTDINTAVHMRDSGLAVARDPNRIQLDPKFVGCTIAALVCGPIGNGCGCESRFVARVRTLTFRLPYLYRLFRSSTYTVKAYEPIPYGPFYMERYPPPPSRLACVH